MVLTLANQDHGERYSYPAERAGKKLDVLVEPLRCSMFFRRIFERFLFCVLNHPV